MKLKKTETQYLSGNCKFLLDLCCLFENKYWFLNQLAITALANKLKNCSQSFKHKIILI